MGLLGDEKGKRTRDGWEGELRRKWEWVKGRKSERGAWTREEQLWSMAGR